MCYVSLNACKGYNHWVSYLECLLEKLSSHGSPTVRISQTLVSWFSNHHLVSLKPSSHGSKKLVFVSPFSRQTLSGSQTVVSWLSDIGVGLSVFSTNPLLKWGKRGLPSTHKRWYSSSIDDVILVGWSCGHSYCPRFLKSCAWHSTNFP